MTSKYTKPLPYTDSWCQTHVNVVEANYTWQINNFSFCNEKPGEALESTVFSSPNNDVLKWRLQFYPCGNNQENKDYVSIFLHLVACDKPAIKVDFRFCILDKDGREVNERKTTDKWQFFQGRQSGFPKFVKRDYLIDPANGMLLQDRLRIVCRIRSATGKVERLGLEHVCPQPPNLLQQMSDDFGKLYEESSFSDVVLEVEDGVRLDAHRNILAARSPIFAAMFRHDMKERRAGIVKIDDLNPETLKAMLRFIYTGKTSVMEPGATVDACDLLGAAEKYALDGLKLACEQALSKNLNVKDAAEWLLVAELHNAPDLKARTLAYIKAHLKEVLDTAGFKTMAKLRPTLLEEMLRSVSDSRR